MHTTQREEHVKSMRSKALMVAALAAVGGATAAANKPAATITAAMVSDVGKFNDRSFNQF